MLGGEWEVSNYGTVAQLGKSAENRVPVYRYLSRKVYKSGRRRGSLQGESLPRSLVQIQPVLIQVYKEGDK